jgi:hypothetical protein
MWLKGEIEKKNNFNKRIKKYKKQKNKNWYKKSKECFDWIVKLKKI